MNKYFLNKYSMAEIFISIIYSFPYLGVLNCNPYRSRVRLHPRPCEARITVATNQQPPPLIHQRSLSCLYGRKKTSLDELWRNYFGFLKVLGAPWIGFSLHYSCRGPSAVLLPNAASRHIRETTTTQQLSHLPIHESRIEDTEFLKIPPTRMIIISPTSTFVAIRELCCCTALQFSFPPFTPARDTRRINPLSISHLNQAHPQLIHNELSFIVS
jgi:hypothetical protein